MDYLYIALNWLFGTAFLLLGLATIITSPLAAITFLIISFLLLPPIRKFAYKKTKIKIPINIRSVAIFILFISSMILSQHSATRREQALAEKEAQAKAQKVAKIRQQSIDYFNQNSSEILSQIKKSYEKENYKQVLSLTSKYLPTQNPELIEINKKAKYELEKLKKESKAKEILAKLKTIPVSKYNENMKFYQQLVNLYPENDAYKQKLNFYSTKLKKQQEQELIKQEKLKKEREERIAKFGEPPTRSSWDGSYLSVKRYLERVANDPDSIKIDGCTEVYYTDNGWLVGCDFRGRNAFGGMIRQSNWFTIVYGRVVQMHEASAYSP